MSQSISSSNSSPSESPCSTDAASKEQSDRLKLLLKKHLSGENAQASHLGQYHKTQFVSRLDEITQQWMPQTIFHLKRYAEKELTVQVENAMIQELQADIERHLPVPTTDEQIDQLKAMYNNFAGNKPNQLPEYRFNAYYLPSGMLPENRTVARIYSALRSKSFEAQSQLWRLTNAIHLLSPTVADSHNTGVLVQKKIYTSIQKTKSAIEGFMLISDWMNYSRGRCSYLKAIALFPQCVDIRLAYFTFERRYFRYIRTAVRYLAHEILLLQHIVMQHIDLLKKPREDYTSSLAAKIVN